MADLDDLLARETGRILPGEIKQRHILDSVWTSGLVKMGTWPDELGSIISLLNATRPAPVDTDTWTDVGLNDGDGNSCVPTATEVDWGTDLQNMKLQHTALKSKPLCVNDIRSSFQMSDQLGAAFKSLAMQNSRMWRDRHRREYTRIAGHKMIANAALSEHPTAFPASAPTSRLTGGILNRIYLNLIRDSAAADGGAVDMHRGMPQFIAVMSPEMDELIINEDYQIREDQRNIPQRVNDLLAPLGIERSYRNFYHMIDLEPPRWNLTDGAWVRVAPTISAAATKGNKAIPNPAYETALAEDTIVFLPNVYECLVPTSITTPGGRVEFDPIDYTGDWAWLNVQDLDTNPRKNWGLFRGDYQAGSKPCYPEFGYVIRHLRGNLPLSLVDADGNLLTV